MPASFTPCTLNAVGNSRLRTRVRKNRGARSTAARTDGTATAGAAAAPSGSSSTEFQITAATLPNCNVLYDIRQRYREATVHIDARSCVAYAKIRPVRQAGVEMVKESIMRCGWTNNSMITCVPDVDYQGEAKSFEEEKQLLQLLPECDRKVYRHGRWKLVDGLHRCIAVSELFRSGKLQHPFIPVVVMSPTMLLYEAQALSFAENCANSEFVYMSVSDNLSVMRCAKQQLQEMGVPDNDSAVADRAAEMSNLKCKGKSIRPYAALESKLCAEAKELLQQDAEQHSREEQCVFSKNNLYMPSPPVYQQAAQVQVAVMKRMIERHNFDRESKNSRCKLELKLIGDWAKTCVSVKAQIEMSNAKLEILLYTNRILEWCSGVKQLLAESYRGAWEGLYDDQIKAAAAQKKLCPHFVNVHEMIMNNFVQGYSLTFAEEQRWERVCAEAVQNKLPKPLPPQCHSLTAAERQHKNKMVKEAEAAAKRALQEAAKKKEQEAQQKKAALAKKRKIKQSKRQEAAKRSKTDSDEKGVVSVEDLTECEIESDCEDEEVLDEEEILKYGTDLESGLVPDTEIDDTQHDPAGGQTEEVTATAAASEFQTLLERGPPLIQGDQDLLHLPCSNVSDDMIRSVLAAADCTPAMTSRARCLLDERQLWRTQQSASTSAILLASASSGENDPQQQQERKWRGDFDRQFTCVAAEVATWLQSEEARNLHGTVDLVIADPPCNEEEQDSRLKNGPIAAADRLLPSTMQAVAGGIKQLLSPSGTALVFCTDAQLPLWRQELATAHLFVEKQTLLIVNDPMTLSYNNRKSGMTKAAMYMLVAHASHTNDHAWSFNRQAMCEPPITDMGVPYGNVLLGYRPPPAALHLRYDPFGCCG